MGTHAMPSIGTCGVNGTNGVATYSPKILVLCFDGTTNTFDDINTNVVKLFQLLDKSNPFEQLCYYQPGVGTYTLPSIVTPITSAVTKVVDMAVAWFFASHVTGGYKFIADNYLPGDKICLFGFSRGAYTARALAGMIEKVGLIPANNPEQIESAWKLYKAVDQASIKRAKRFKKTFSRAVDIDFVGVWDTVSSVGGIIERRYPFTAKNKSIKIFRHAISLDERRVKFAQNRFQAWVRSYDNAENDSEPAGAKNIGSTTTGRPRPGGWAYCTDVEEVYFAGDHADVGGGREKDEVSTMLSNIPMEWMLQQIEKTGVGIRFDQSALSDWRAAYHAAYSPSLFQARDPAIEDGAVFEGATAYNSNANILPEVGDALAVQKWGDLITVPLWWILECFPFRRMYQDLNDPKKRWRSSFWPHVGRARIVAPGSKVHESVRDKMAIVSRTGKKYVPKAELPEDIKWVS